MKSIHRARALLLAIGIGVLSTQIALGQDLFEQAQLSAGLQDPAYLKAREDSRLAAGRDGLDKLLASHQLQAIIAPTMGPAYLIDTIAGDTISASGPGGLPAIAGYPHLTLPMGMVKGLPVGLSLIGSAWTDRPLLTLGAGVERVLDPVPPPRYIVHSAQGIAAR
jgi:amidase